MNRQRSAWHFGLWGRFVLLTGSLAIAFVVLLLAYLYHAPGWRIGLGLVFLLVAIVLASAFAWDLVLARRRLEESETRYRTLVEHSPDAIVILSGGRLTFVNPAGVRLLGAATADELMGRSLRELVLGDDPPPTQVLVDGVLERAAAQTVQAQTWTRADGSRVEVELTATPLLFEGRPAVQLVIRNVTERRRLERLKDEFVSTVNHELRTPLTSVRGALGLLANDSDGFSPKHRSLIDIAHRNCERLTRLINDILDVQRLAVGEMRLVKRPVAVRKAIEAALTTYVDPAARQQVEVRVSDEASLVVEADEERLVQIVGQLVSNAVKHSPSGETVEITASRRGDRLAVAVTNRGLPIPADLGHRLFDRFYRLEGSPSRAGLGGAGLGLAIAKDLVELHGGVIDFVSRREETTFFFELPSLLPASEG